MIVRVCPDVSTISIRRTNPSFLVIHSVATV
jgi:hypothetical protein